MRIASESHWNWCLEHEDPEAMAFAERLANLLEHELDKSETIRETMRAILKDKLSQAGVDRLTDSQRRCAFKRLIQCWGAYSMALDEALEEAGYEY